MLLILSGQWYHPVEGMSRDDGNWPCRWPLRSWAGWIGQATGETTLFLNHLLALLIVSVFTFFGSLLLYRLVSVFTRLRVSEEEEAMGLDISQHEESVLLQGKSFRR